MDIPYRHFQLIKGFNAKPTIELYMGWMLTLQPLFTTSNDQNYALKMEMLQQNTYSVSMSFQNENIAGIRVHDSGDFNSVASRKGLHMQNLMNTEFKLNHFFGSCDSAKPSTILWLLYRYAVCLLPD